MDRKLLLVLPLVAVIVVSGCTSLDLSGIPFLGTLFGPATVKYTNDIIIIRSLESTPSTVFPGQQVRVTAYVQNQGRKAKDVAADLYDYCEGTFKDPVKECGQTTSQGTSAQIGCSDSSKTCCSMTLQPYETRGVSWTLTADKCIALDTTCPADGMKVSVGYYQETEGLTTITLLRYEEMQRQMTEGTYKETQPTRSVGEGPIKGYIGIEDKHPVAVSDENPQTVISFQLKNEGNGFLANILKSEGNKPWVNLLEGINLGTPPIGKIDTTGLDSNDSKSNCNTLSPSGGMIELIKGESPKIVCVVKRLKNDFEKQISKTLKFKISYGYEFRSSVKVTVKPKALTALPDECRGGTAAGLKGPGQPCASGSECLSGACLGEEGCG